MSEQSVLQAAKAFLADGDAQFEEGYITKCHALIERLCARLEVHEEDLRLAAGELLIEVPQPGSTTARLCIANRLLRAENQCLRARKRDFADLDVRAHYDATRRMFGDEE